MRTQEERDAAKRRREARKAKKQAQVSSYESNDDTSEHKRPDQLPTIPDMLTDTQLIAELKRLPILERHWDYDMTSDNKREMVSMIRAKIEAGDEDSLSTMMFDSYYALVKEEKIVKDSGVLGGYEDINIYKKERRERRREQRQREKGELEGNTKGKDRTSTMDKLLEGSKTLAETKNKNNPLHSRKRMVRSNHGSDNRERKIRESTGDNTMILVNTKTNTELKLKVRSKGAPNYADSGDNRAITLDGKKFNLVLNPKQENNKSKRVGLSFNNKWYFVDDETIHAEVKGYKGVTVFETKKKAEKPAKATSTKADTPKKAEGNGKPAKKAAAKKPAKKAAPKKAKGAEAAS